MCLVQLELLAGEDTPAALVLKSMGYREIGRSEDSKNYIFVNQQNPK